MPTSHSATRKKTSKAPVKKSPEPGDSDPKDEPKATPPPKPSAGKKSKSKAPAKKAPERSPADKKTIVRRMPVKLITEEKAAIGGELATAQQSLNEIDEEKKDLMAQMKARMTQAKARITELSNQLASGRKFEHVECTEEKNYATMKFSVTRDDTGEVLEERPLTSDERQLGLFEDDDDDGS